MNNKEAKHLLEKYLSGNCTPDELILIKTAYNKEIPDDVGEISENRYDEMRANIWNNLEQLTRPQAKKYRLWPKIAVAAILLMTTGIGLYFFNLENNTGVNQVVSVYANDVPAGKNTAVLTLTNGKQIRLSDAKSGIVVKTSWLTYNDGTIIKGVNSKDFGISSISTPRGGQYNIELPDGTKVALNAASTLKFPTTFLGSVNRTVELAGEGYFQVTKDKNHPFIVVAKDQEVKVLGTSFNVKAYSDEKDIKTTLVEGTINVSTTKYRQLLKPGQRSKVSNGQITVHNVLVKNDIAWKNGILILNAESIEEMMNIIARWYNVKVIYSDDMENTQGKSAGFLAQVSNSVELEKVIHLIEKTGILSVTLEGRTLYVTNAT